jgi:quercetin dioxygenase-like cupin family protein
MRLIFLTVFLLILAYPAPAQTPQAAMPGPAKPVWGPVGPELPKGAEIAVLQGDPAKPALFTVRLKMPQGYILPPHYHDTELHVTVITGEFSAGMGDRVDLPKAAVLRPGDFITVGAKQHHFDAARTAAEVQIYGLGPFSITYVNPQDDPRRKPSR